QVCNRLKFHALKQSSHRAAIAKIDMVNGHVFGKTGNVCVLYLRIVKIIEVIEDGDFMLGREQLLGEMGADETSAACDQNSHENKLATDKHRWTPISEWRSLSRCLLKPLTERRRPPPLLT